MNCRKSNMLAVVLTAFVGVTAANAQNAPKQLYNKSITLSFVVGQKFKRDDGRIGYPSTPTEIQIYISSAGRVFDRNSRSSRVGGAVVARKDEQGPSSGDGNMSIRFSGNQLIRTNKYPVGARMMIAAFDAGFSSCTLSVQFGKEGGNNIRLKGLDGVNYEVLESTVSHQSCSVKEGNIFAR